MTSLRVPALLVSAPRPDAPEAEAFRRLLPPDLWAAGQGFLGTMPRDVVLRLLASIAPGTLDLLEDEGMGAPWRLPIIYAARRGVRPTSIEYEVSG
jgi:hypothetical protein